MRRQVTTVDREVRSRTAVRIESRRAAESPRSSMNVAAVRTWGEVGPRTPQRNVNALEPNDPFEGAAATARGYDSISRDPQATGTRHSRARGPYPLVYRVVELLDFLPSRENVEFLVQFRAFDDAVSQVVASLDVFH